MCFNNAEGEMSLCLFQKEIESLTNLNHTLKSQFFLINQSYNQKSRKKSLQEVCGFCMQRIYVQIYSMSLIFLINISDLTVKVII